MSFRKRVNKRLYKKEKRCETEQLMKAKRKGVREVATLGGFTEPAKEYAQKRKMKLFHRGRRVV